MTIKKKRSKRRKNHYFTKVHEEAIVEYAKLTSDSQERRTLLYVEFIQPAFDEMVNKIIFTYRFTSLPNIDSLRDECKVWLTTILDKYDPSKGSKAFSYFSVVTKNWFIHKVKRNAIRAKREIFLEDMINELAEEVISKEKQYVDVREEAEFWQNFFEELAGWDSDMLKENEKKVLGAVKIIFESSNDIEIFNKKAIYLYLREITGLNTKQVVNNLNKLRKKYRVFKGRWESGEI
tara:strand:+ start:7889 stop:8593 length:705 start_codon:yes stop_codon:yes gene_type:complete